MAAQYVVIGLRSRASVLPLLGANQTKRVVTEQNRTEQTVMHESGASHGIDDIQGPHSHSQEGSKAAGRDIHVHIRLPRCRALHAVIGYTL